MTNRAAPQLAFVKVTRSAVLPFPQKDVWALVRNWGNMGLWFSTIHPVPGAEGQPFRTNLLPGYVEGMIGAQRILSLGDNGRICEQLTSLNDESCTLSYKLVSNQMNSNPFPASFVNSQLTQSLQPVTVTNHTYFVWTVELYTDFEAADLMRLSFTHMFDEGFVNLQNFMMKQRAETMAASVAAAPFMVNPIASTVLPPPAMPYLQQPAAYAYPTPMQPVQVPTIPTVQAALAAASMLGTEPTALLGAVAKSGTVAPAPVPGLAASSPLVAPALAAVASPAPALAAVGNPPPAAALQPSAAAPRSEVKASVAPGAYAQQFSLPTSSGPMTSQPMQGSQMPGLQQMASQQQQQQQQQIAAQQQRLAAQQQMASQQHFAAQQQQLATQQQLLYALSQAQQQSHQSGGGTPSAKASNPVFQPAQRINNSSESVSSIEAV